MSSISSPDAARVGPTDLREGRRNERSLFAQVDTLPLNPPFGSAYWIEGGSSKPEYTHGFVRFPAKFHVPVVKWALRRYPSARRILDPFTGSGTVQVEALLDGRDSIGVDIDPLAALVARVKTTPVPQGDLLMARDRVLDCLARMRPTIRAVEETPGGDISEREFTAEISELWIPAMPNLQHWFRRYVICDLALLLSAIEKACLPRAVRDFFLCSFASVLRRVSNADPHPVSGLEVTRIQKELNGTRKIPVLRTFLDRLDRNIAGMQKMIAHLEGKGRTPTSRVIHGDSTALQRLLTPSDEHADLVITSPPYCRAVEYSRRHKLEMYWLGFVHDPDDHISLAHKYIGRTRVKKRESIVEAELSSAPLRQVLSDIETRDLEAYRSITAYFSAMQNSFASCASVLTSGVPFVCVVGDSRCAGVDVPTADVLVELADRDFHLDTRFDYAIRNHYMQYGLRNGHGIKREHVLVFARR